VLLNLRLGCRLAALLAFAVIVGAQPPEMARRAELAQQNTAAQRFELGQRLRAVEAAWDAQTDAAARKRAAFLLKNAVTKFFSAQPGDAARALDNARFMLQAGDATPEKIWAESLYLKPESRLFDTAATSLPFALERLYTVPSALPEGAQLRVELGVPNRKAFPSWQGEVKDAPTAAALPLRGIPEGDYILHTAITLQGKLLAVSDQTVSFAARLAPRVAQLRKDADLLPAGTDAKTAQFLAGLLEKLASKETLETNFPASRLLAQAESVVAAAKQKRTALGGGRAGQFWLSLFLDEQDALPSRLAVPEAAKAGQPLPLVIALHGAGGSENLFFDGYGRGAVAKLALQRGWLVAAPRNIGSDAARLQLFIDALAKLYPVDRNKIFLVGHSMGAAQSVALASNMPGKLAGVALLGGGGRPRGYDNEQFKKLPFFIGIGTEDFAFGGAKTLNTAFGQIGVEQVNYREYDDVEHLAIVQVALPDVFAFFDEIAAGR
jgi:predicted peptidase